MKPLTQRMVESYGCKQKSLDFMGYDTTGGNWDFHHLIVPKRESKEAGIGDGYVWWNGACLNHDTGHPYLHTVERVDRDMFLYITQRLIDENLLGKLDLQLLKQIDSALKSFEREHCSDLAYNKKPLIRERYLKRDFRNKF